MCILVNILYKMFLSVVETVKYCVGILFVH